MEGIQVSVEKTGPQSDISIIRVGGYIDTTTSSELERALDSLLKAGVYQIIIDLGNVDYISSAGWGIFISEIKGIRERGGDLKLARMIPDVYEVFELLEFHYILKAFGTIEDAIKHFDKDQGEGVFVEEESAEETGPEVEEKTGEEEEKEIDLEVSSEEGLDSLDIEEKVKHIALEHPSWSASKLVKELNTEKYGFIRANVFSVWKMLRKLGLGSRKDREAVSREEPPSDQTGG
jgi:anti-sigma B factor antagonist